MTKMSPDPPRESSQEDLMDPEMVEGAVYFMAMADADSDDDFMADADEHGGHELDYDNDDNDESDFSDAEDTEVAGISMGPLTGTPGLGQAEGQDHGPNTRMMAHYQLLIPFQTAERNRNRHGDQEQQHVTSTEGETETAGSSISVGTDGMETDDSQSPSVSDSGSKPSPGPAAAIEKLEDKKEVDVVADADAGPDADADAEKSRKPREINLTEDKVELIKNAMKDFTLPSSSIPNWAEEIDETSWKERLTSTIQRKGDSPNANSNSNTKSGIPSCGDSSSNNNKNTIGHDH